MKIEAPVAATASPAPEPVRPDIQRPPVPEPEREEKEYLEWRQELL